MHENIYVPLHTVTASMFQDENDIFGVTFMQLRDPSAFMFQEWSSNRSPIVHFSGDACFRATTQEATPSVQNRLRILKRVKGV